MDRLARDYRGDAYVRFIDIDDPRNSGLVNTYGAFSIPLMVIMNDQGEVVYPVRGLTPEATELANRLRYSHLPDGPLPGQQPLPGINDQATGGPDTTSGHHHNEVSA